MIKNAVITKAHAQIKEDRIINQALDTRRKSAELGEAQFRDNKVNILFNQLPIQLRPNINGLTEDQFQVYKDFSKLSYKSKFDQVPIGGNGNSSGDTITSEQKQKTPAQYDFGLDALIGRLLEEKPLNSVTRSLVTIKIDHLSKMGKEGKEEKSQLWKFCDSQFNTLVQLWDAKQIERAN